MAGSTSFGVRQCLALWQSASAASPQALPLRSLAGHAVQRPCKAIGTDAIERAQAHSPFLALALRPPARARRAARSAATARPRWPAARRAGEGAPDVAVGAAARAAGAGDRAGDRRPGRRVSARRGSWPSSAPSPTGRSTRRSPMPSAAACPMPRPPGFTAIALGKQGAQELNYSSDIDPILLYDPARLPRRERDEPGEAAQRYAADGGRDARRAQTGEGYVFRVDLRLRPASEVSPLAISFDAALSHYESSALAWERAAFIRARAAAGDVAAGEAFLAAIRPFVWRRSLDFSAIEEIRRLTARIREAYRGPREPGPGFDLKRGRGGHPRGRVLRPDPPADLRRAPARAAPARHARRARCAGGRRRDRRRGRRRSSASAYDRLRTIEHRLQMVARPADPCAAGRRGRRSTASPGSTGWPTARRWSPSCTRSAGRWPSATIACSAPANQAPPPAPVGRRSRTCASGCASGAGALARDDPQLARRRGARGARRDAARPARGARPARPSPTTRWPAGKRCSTRLPSAVNLFRLFEQRPGLLELVLRMLTLARRWPTSWRAGPTCSTG